MKQDKMDDEIRDLFGSLNEQDKLQAVECKEAVWQTLSLQEKKKAKRGWLLLLLPLGILLFAAGWLLRPVYTGHSAPPAGTTLPTQQLAESVKESDYKLALDRIQTMLDVKSKSLDSLIELNAALSSRLQNQSQNSTQQVAIKEVKRLVRDTFYMTTVKVEERLIEKIIRDTILIEIPAIDMDLQSMAEADADPKENELRKGKQTEKPDVPSSVQFNFIEANLKD